jgi:hypothetical protein
MGDVTSGSVPSGGVTAISGSVMSGSGTLEATPVEDAGPRAPTPVVDGVADGGPHPAYPGGPVEGGPLAPSWAAGGPGMTSCGASESCCTSLDVPGGTYYRTYANLGLGSTNEADPATISSFRLDKFLVTVGRFRQFMNAWSEGWAPAPGSGKHAHLNGGEGLVSVGSDAGTLDEPGWVATDDSRGWRMAS